MSKPVYIALDASGNATQPGDHRAVRVERAGVDPITVTAFRSEKPLTHEEATKWAEGLNTNGWKWRLPTAEEAFLICDRTREDNVLPPEFFPDCEGEWIWTSTPTAWNSGAAWFVDLGLGGSSWSGRYNRSRVRAVRASQ